VGIVGGIFAEDELSSHAVEELVDTFGHQAIDFFSALRSRIYDEQIRQFIHQVGFENISQRVVNSIEGVPVFQKPNFTLSELINAGHLMVNQQQRVENSQLVDEYNRLNRGRNYQQPSLSQLTPPVVIKPVTPDHYPSLDLEIQNQIRQILSQGHQIGIEHVDERRFRIGSWQSCGKMMDTASDAIATLESCLAEYRSEYIRLVGIDPKAKRRVIETIIQRPH
jgi:ribulose bisphosphate carboxylase small subunit